MSYLGLGPHSLHLSLVIVLFWLVFNCSLLRLRRYGRLNFVKVLLISCYQVSVIHSTLCFNHFNAIYPLVSVIWVIESWVNGLRMALRRCSPTAIGYVSLSNATRLYCLSYPFRSNFCFNYLPHTIEIRV